MKKSMRRTFVIVVMAVIAGVVMLLSGCSDGGEESDSGTVTKYGYKLNYNSNYHLVRKYIAIDNGDNTFDVKSVSVHFFSISNDNYKNRAGGELCDMVKTNAVKPSSSEEITLASDMTQTIKNTITGLVETFYTNKGLRYTVYYYF